LRAGVTKRLDRWWSWCCCWRREEEGREGRRKAREEQASWSRTRNVARHAMAAGTSLGMVPL